MHRGRRRPHEDDGGDRYYKRRRTSYHDRREEEDPLKAVIFELGTKPNISIESSIEGAAKILEADLSSNKGKILQLLTDVITAFPEKCTMYSTLAGLLNAKNYNLGGEYVESVIKSFKEQLRSCNWQNAQCTFRFIADLVNCHIISATSLLQLYDTFLEGAMDTSVPQVRRDWLVYVVLNSLPWVGRELYDKKEQTVERLMITIDNYMKRRKKLHHKLIRVWVSDEPHPQEEYLDCLWAQVEKLKLDGWMENHIYRPYLSFDSILCEALQHKLPQIVLPPHHDNIQYPLPKVIFRMFDYTDCPDGPSCPVLPGAHSIERYLIEEELRDILRKHHTDRKECAQLLLEYPQNERVPVEYMAVEVLFGELMRLPVPEYLDIAYAAVLIELCKKQPGLMPRILAQSTELFFARLDTMSVACFDKFVTWFAYHLSNFQFRWGWEDWAAVVDFPDLEHPKPKFIAETLQKAIRLSYYERIVEAMPKEYEKLIPPPFEPKYTYGTDKDDVLSAGMLGNIQAKQLQAAFRGKAPPEDIIVIMRETPNPIEGDEGMASHNPLAIDVFCQTLLMLGSKSLSHAQAAIAKYQPVFKALVENEDAQICVLKSSYEMWRKDTQMLSVIVDLLLKYQIVSCAAVANWVFMQEATPDFTRIFLWEILHLTIRKMNKHVKKLSTELSEAREKMRTAEMNSSESDNEESGVNNGTKNKDTNKEIPTEEQVDKMEEKLELAQADQKNLFLIVFQRFIMILSEHIARCDTDGRNVNTLWYRWTIGRLQQVFLQHADQVAQYSSTLETLLFTQDLDRNILEIFHQFQALRN